MQKGHCGAYHEEGWIYIYIYISLSLSPISLHLSLSLSLCLSVSLSLCLSVSLYLCLSVSLSLSLSLSLSFCLSLFSIAFLRGMFVGFLSDAFNKTLGRIGAWCVFHFCPEALKTAESAENLHKGAFVFCDKLWYAPSLRSKDIRFYLIKGSQTVNAEPHTQRLAEQGLSRQV